MMRAIRRTIAWLVALGILATAAFVLWALAKGQPQDLPWTPLDLGRPIGLATGRKLTALGRDFPQCRRVLEAAGIRYATLPPRQDGPDCGYEDGVRVMGGGARRIAFAPSGLGTACPVAAALSMWEWDVIQPAAQNEFGSRVVGIDHFGSYNCRRMYGREEGSFSEHATADAIDIAGFRLADGTRVTVARDWSGDDAKARFLHRVRDGACRLFATTLSPDYNAAHHDHLHLDQADRGAIGWRACR